MSDEYIEIVIASKIIEGYGLRRVTIYPYGDSLNNKGPYAYLAEDDKKYKITNSEMLIQYMRSMHSEEEIEK